MSVSRQLNWYMDSKQTDIPVYRVFVAAAECARKQGSVTEVEPLYRKAINLARRSLGEPNKEIGGILLRLADFHVERQDFEAAETTYRNAVEAFEHNESGGSILLAAALSKLAEFYEMRGNRSQSEHCWERVKSILSEQLKSMVED